MGQTDLNAEAIRSGREAAGWSIAQAARELRRRAPDELPDLDSVVRSWKRWEAGTRPSRGYRALLTRLFGGTAAAKARDMGWWQRYDQHEVPNWLSLFVGLEQGASDLRTYQPVVMPGLLQTPDYAAAVLDSDPVPRTEAHVDRLVALRIARQAALTRSADPLRLRVILDESVLHRTTGRDHVMGGQIRHLAAMAERPNIDVQVLPLAAGVHSAAFGAFVILGIPWESDPGLVYVENRSGAVYLESSHEIDAHSLVFQQLSVLALNTKESVDLLRKTAKGIQS